VPLAFYARSATEAFWSEHWAGEDVEALVRIARDSPLTDLIERALPADGVVLEGGCGLGPYVLLLRRRGRVVAGADWSLDALRRCRAADSRAPLAVMDLGHLAVRSGSLAGYISLGVVEHDERGPDAIVADAARALAPGGRLVLSVPYWNGVRRILTRRLVEEGRRVQAAGGQFYQYAFSRREVRAFLEARGFRVLSFHPYDPARMFRARFRWLAARLGGGAREGGTREGGAPADAPPRGRARPSPRRIARAALRRALYGDASLRLFGHMILAVAVKR